MIFSHAHFVFFSLYVISVGAFSPFHSLFPSFKKTTKLNEKINQDYSNMFPTSPIDEAKKVLPAGLSILIATCMSPIVVSAVGVSKGSSEKVVQYLKDPTDEFKSEEALNAAFRTEQLKKRKSWDEIIEKLEKSQDSDSILTSLKQMKGWLTVNGVPVGVKKMEVVKLCRSIKFNGKKIKPIWTTDVEIAYVSFIQEFNRQLSPDNKV